jgi:hypothetical protein
MLRRFSRPLLMQSTTEKAATWAFSRILGKGMAYGGLGGGLLGLAIELSPEDSALKTMARQLAPWAFKVGNILEGNELSPPAPEPVPTTSVQVILPPKPDPTTQPETPVVVNVNPETHPTPDSVTQAEPVHDDPPPSEDLPTPPTHPAVEEQASVPSPGEEESTPSTHPVFEEPASVSDTPSEEPEEEPAEMEETRDNSQENELDSLHSRIASLTRQLTELEQVQREQDERRAGADRATIETMDRLYSEREQAIEIAKQSIAVVKLLEDLARDESGFSPGALRVAFERATPKIIRACFTPEETSTVSRLVSSAMAKMYSVDDHVAYQETSPTSRRLAALQRVRECVEKADFIAAYMHLGELEGISVDAKEFRAKTKIALTLWQSSTAAIAHIYDDLSRII